MNAKVKPYTNESSLIILLPLDFRKWPTYDITNPAIIGVSIRLIKANNLESINWWGSISRLMLPITKPKIQYPIKENIGFLLILLKGESDKR